MTAGRRHVTSGRRHMTGKVGLCMSCDFRATIGRSSRFPLKELSMCIML